ncbi:hypothetical protein JJJA_0010 [Achromobacter phage JWDelta]|uniref:Uncharacterized protein n=2 Tax=Jwalphavirus jwalpha TaxID=2169963 RepID=V9VHL0_9CAUD|nr:hypothetical protein CH29_gp10 [Achromobacter phage JWAlpha]AHC56526.1 hypothetical protein JJJA_0010 [Achromobacter phage JWDelta]AHC93963.1 hypothetical protein JJJB_0010 [Achromobacter phage JWAlpha]
MAITVITKPADIAATADTLMLDIEYPNALGNPLGVNERWDADFLKEQYSKYILMKIRDNDEAAMNRLNAIAEHAMAGGPVILIQGAKDVHGQVLADFIQAQIDAA